MANSGTVSRSRYANSLGQPAEPSTADDSPDAPMPSYKELSELVWDDVENNPGAFYHAEPRDVAGFMLENPGLWEQDDSKQGWHSNAGFYTELHTHLGGDTANAVVEQVLKLEGGHYKYLDDLAGDIATLRGLHGVERENVADKIENAVHKKRFLNHHDLLEEMMRAGQPSSP